MQEETSLRRLWMEDLARALSRKFPNRADLRISLRHLKLKQLFSLRPGNLESGQLEREASILQASGPYPQH